MTKQLSGRFPRVLVIIVTYNGLRWIKSCLNSIRQSSLPVEVVVIDNASCDGTSNVVRQEFEDIKLIVSERNLGFGVANNVGLKIAVDEDFDYVVLLNQDTHIEEETFEKLIRISQKYPYYAVLSPLHLDYQGFDIERYFKEWVMEYYTPGLKRDWQRGQMKEVYTTSFVHAACWLVQIETVRAVGGFDPLFFHYGEDNDYVQRLNWRNLRIGIIPEAKVYHEGSNEGLINPMENLTLLLNQATLLFKNPVASHTGAVMLFLKQFFLAHVKGEVIKAKAYRKNMNRILKLMSSRCKQFKYYAYLDNTPEIP